MLAATLCTAACTEDGAEATAGVDGVEGSGVGGTGVETSSGSGVDPGDPSGGGTDDPSGFPPSPDLPDEPPPWPDAVPATCAAAEQSRSSMGCEFLAMALENAGELPPLGPAGAPRFAVVVANVQREQEVSVTVEAFQVDGWVIVMGPTVVAPLATAPFEIDAQSGSGAGVIERGALRITADHPVAAYQFNGITPVRSSDASMLLPTSSWETLHRVASRPILGDEAAHSYVAVGAMHETGGTVIGMLAGSGEGEDEEPTATYDFFLDAADFLQVVTAPPTAAVASALVDSFDVPVAVFGGSACWRMPEGLNLRLSCSHLEEQLPGVSWWGTTVVAARPPSREDRAFYDDPWLIQVLAHHDGTTISFEGSSWFDRADVTLDAGEAFDGVIYDDAGGPGDGIVRADKPVLVLGYTSSVAVESRGPGDPTMVMLPAIDQYVARHVVFIPEGWDEDWITIVRPVGAAVVLDGVALAGDVFRALGEYEIARVRVDDGTHVIEGSEPIATTVVGYGDADAYAYVGGLAAPVRGARPEG